MLTLDAGRLIFIASRLLQRVLNALEYAGVTSAAIAIVKPETVHAIGFSLNAS